MKIPILLTLIAISNLLNGYSSNSKNAENVFENSQSLVLDCPCFPGFAGADKVTCLSTPAESVVIGCNDGGSSECNDLCYEWVPALGITEIDRKKKNPTVSPNVTTTYTVAVKNTKTGESLGTSTMTVFVVEIELVLYKPKVIAGNTTTSANPMLGAQTFVNLDNDDNDGFYDDDVSELGVVGGDDELVRAELKLKPDNLPDKFARLFAVQGASNIKVWKDNAKTAGNEYILNTDIELADRGTYLGVDLWIEGLQPHTMQRETLLRMSYKGSSNCNTPVGITIVGVSDINWSGFDNNSVNDDNTLDDDPKYIAPIPVPMTWPSAKRIFPDARLPDNSIAKNSSKLIVMLTVPPVEDINIFVRAFDVDDPDNNVNFVDPNDAAATPTGIYSGTMLTYTAQEDNRTAGSKSGNFVGQVGNSATILFSANIKKNDIIFNNISMHPGDNYRAVVNGDVDFLNNLENLDSRDGHKIVDPNVFTIGSNPKEIQDPQKYSSPVLTVWRFLHLEEDSMKAYDPNTSDNTIFAIFHDFFSPTNQGNNITQVNNSADYITEQSLPLTYNIDFLPTRTAPADGTPNTNDPHGACYGLGRFSGGRIIIPGQTPTASIISNGDFSIDFPPVAALNIVGATCRLKKGVLTAAGPLAGIKRVSANSFIWLFNPLTLVIPAGVTLNDFVGGTFTITGSTPFVHIINIIAANPANNTITTDGFALKMQLIDDDGINTLLPALPSLDSLDNVYNQAYLKYKILPGYTDLSVPFDCNLGDESSDNLPLDCTSSGLENASFWVVYAQEAWQDHSTTDYDHNYVTIPTTPPCVRHEDNPFLGRTINAGGVPAIKVHNIDLAQGGEYSFIYKETIRELNLVTPYPEAITVAHEIGHQFGLGHGDAMTTGGQIPEFNTGMGLMSSGNSTTTIIPRHKNLIRSRQQSPGH